MKRLIILLVLGLVALGVLFWFVKPITGGTIVISTNKSGSTITLQRISQGNPFVRIGIGSLTTKLTKGTYVATVKNGSLQSAQTINFKGTRGTAHYVINPSSLTQVEPVAYQNTQSLAASNEELVYLNSSDENIHKIDSQNSISTVNSSQQLQDIKWATTTFGVGQDDYGHLYLVNGGVISPLKLPFTYSGRTVSYDVAQNKQIYVSYGTDVYVGSQAGNYKKIFTAPSSSITLYAGNSGVGVWGQTSGQSVGASQPYLALVSSGGKVVKRTGGGMVSRMALSPDSKYVVVTNESSTVVYDSSLNQVVAIPDSTTAAHAQWLDNNRFVYNTSTGVWVFGMNNLKADLLALLPSVAGNVTSLSVASDKAYVYLTSVDTSTDSSYAVLRVGLNGQTVPTYVYKLQGVLPIQLADCSISLVNFKQPATILVQTYPNSNLDNQGYLQEAQNELSQDGFDVSTLRFEVASGG